MHYKDLIEYVIFLGSHTRVFTISILRKVKLICSKMLVQENGIANYSISYIHNLQGI